MGKRAPRYRFAFSAVQAVLAVLLCVSPAVADAIGAEVKQQRVGIAASGPADIEHFRPFAADPGSLVDLDAEEASPRPAAAPAEDSRTPAAVATPIEPLGGSPSALLKFDTTLWGNDPQIAVSKKYVVVTSYAAIAVYDKTGVLLPGKNGHTFANPFYTVDFYRPAWDPSWSDNINAHLNLPSAMKCDKTKDITKPADDAATKYCIDDFYDTRVFYDSKRNRFWFVSLARNSQARNVTDPFILMGRRSFVIVAVTKTEDPRDGFYEFFWDGSIDQGDCNLPLDIACSGSTFHPGDAGDYPSFSVTDKYLVRTHNVNNVISGNGRYGLVSVALADDLANGTCNSCSWSFWNIKGTSNDILRSIAPAYHRTTNSLGLTFFAHDYGSKMLVLALVQDSDHPNGQPAGFLDATVKLTRPFAGAIDAKLPGTSDTMLLSNIGNYALGVVYDGNYLYASFQDCTVFSGGPSKCSDGVRVVRVNVANFLGSLLSGLPKTASSGFLDMTFGLHTSGDPDDAVIQYGLPGLMVNKNGQMVTVFVRAGEELEPEARYSVFYPGETLFRASTRLRKGDFPATGNLDTAGMALDPSDKLTVWMVHGFGDSVGRTHRLVVGKVKP